jgi:hypothetical protein
MLCDRHANVLQEGQGRYMLMELDSTVFMLEIDCVLKEGGERRKKTRVFWTICRWA